MWPAIIRTVLRGAPGTGADQRARGKRSKRNRVTRLLVLQAARIVSRRSGGEGMTLLSFSTSRSDVLRLTTRVSLGRSPNGAEGMAQAPGEEEVERPGAERAPKGGSPGIDGESHERKRNRREEKRRSERLRLSAEV